MGGNVKVDKVGFREAICALHSSQVHFECVLV